MRNDPLRKSGRWLEAIRRLQLPIAVKRPGETEEKHYRNGEEFYWAWAYQEGPVQVTVGAMWPNGPHRPHGVRHLHRPNSGPLPPVPSTPYRPCPASAVHTSRP